MDGYDVITCVDKGGAFWVISGFYHHLFDVFTMGVFVSRWVATDHYRELWVWCWTFGYY